MQAYTLIILSLFCLSCNSDKQFTREHVKLNKQTFYSHSSEANVNSSIAVITTGVNKAFELTGLERSPFPYEMRIYFAHAWGETFFRECYDPNGMMTAQLFICETAKSNDSLFMKTKETVTTQGKVGYDKSFHLESLESDTAIIENLHSPNDIDGGAFTFIQLKNLSSYQYIIVHGDFDTDSNSNILKDVRKLIKRTTRNFSFWFPATDIADSVFSRPFVWN